MVLTEVPHDEWNYPTWVWPDTATQLLFDIGFSYAMLREAETMLRALSMALEDHGGDAESNRQLKARLDHMLAKMENFREKRLNARDEIYDAGYLAAAKLEPCEEP